MTGLSTSIVVGPGGHGVVRHALAIADLTGSRTMCMASPGPLEAEPVTSVAHVHYTDRLFGSTAERAADACAKLLDSLPCPTVVTLHDVPAGTTSTYDQRRATCYRRVVEAADAIVVSSDHERERLRDCDVQREPTVIALPIEPAPCAVDNEPLPVAEPMVAVLGYVYPGKGHLQVLEAMATLPAELSLWALGAVSPGHDEVLGELERLAVRIRRRVVVTGHLDDKSFAAAVRRADVPIVPAAAPSASASLATWIAHGRRPLVAASPYACELAAAAPQLVRLYEPGDERALVDEIARACADPASTMRTVPIPECFRGRTVAARHLEVYRRTAERNG